MVKVIGLSEWTKVLVAKESGFRFIIEADHSCCGMAQVHCVGAKAEYKQDVFNFLKRGVFRFLAADTEETYKDLEHLGSKYGDTFSALLLTGVDENSTQEFCKEFGVEELSSWRNCNSGRKVTVFQIITDQCDEEEW